jgi:hypothetical protein
MQRRSCHTPRLVRAILCGVVLLTTAGCVEPRSQATPPVVDLDSDPTLLACPASETSSTTEVIDPLGGAVSAAGTTISLPAGAVLAPTTIKVTVPASQYMEVEITANGLASFLFQKPVTISVNYSRCPTNLTDGKALTAWRIDTQGKALLENMGGSNDAPRRTYIFSTGHLSGYAIAQ